MTAGKSRGTAFRRPAPSHSSSQRINFSVVTSPVIPLSRRALLALGTSAAASSGALAENTMSTNDQFWPNNARLAVSFSLMFEAGG